MKKHLFLFIQAISYFACLNNTSAQAATALNAGKVRFFNHFDSAFHERIKKPTVIQQKWMRAHYPRMLTHSPSFDEETSWYPGGLVYIDSYAIYTDDDLALSHPEWIMRDVYGNKLYIPWGCENGQCPQFAGDFSNPDFRAYMITKIKTLVAKGYRGLWLDDVNLTWRVGKGNINEADEFIVPVDSNTGKPMTLDDWQHYFAQYLEEIRAALPKTVEISHNAIWYADTMQTENPYITRQIKAATYVNLERGGNDNGLVKGTGRWGYETFLKYIDYVHQKGASVILMDQGADTTQREYGLATWFLISQGKDLFKSYDHQWSTPNNWWKGYDLNLGKALNNRYKWHQTIRRDFACGSVFLNQPDTSTLIIGMGNSYKNIAGLAVKSIKLKPKTAAILTTTCNNARKVPVAK